MRELYPWGNREPSARLANFAAGSKHGSTTRVHAHPEGASPYGLLDMAGNVWEWTSTAYAAYPVRAGDGREDPRGGAPRVLRGGSFASMTSRFVRCGREAGATRAAVPPTSAFVLPETWGRSRE